MRLGIGLMLAASSMWAQPAFSIAPGGVQNSASQAPPSLPNGSLSPGSIFIVYLNIGLPVPFEPVTSYPLPTTFHDVSMTVTVNGVTTQVLIAGTFPLSTYTQLRAILPSSTPHGAGTITVSYKGQTTPPEPIAVVAHSFAWYAANGQGFGPGAVTDLQGKLLTPIHAANPGQVVVAYGTGLGAAPGTDTNGGAAELHPADLKMFVGNQQVIPTYTGRSSSAGEDQVNFTIPPDVAGCAVPLTMQIGSIVSNTATIPIATSGNLCSDANGFSSADLQTAISKGSLSYASISLARTATILAGSTSVSNRSDIAGASFDRITTGGLITSLGPFQQISLGYCAVYTFSGSSAAIADPTAVVPLDAGPALSVSGPAGAMAIPKTNPGTYFAPLGNDYLNPGSYTVTGTGGTDAGPFTTSLALPNPLVWTNQSTIGPVTRSQGALVNWEGGNATDVVVISGFSGLSSPPAGAFFSCAARASAKQFLVPASVLLALPVSGTGNGLPFGQMSVGNVSAPVRFVIPNLDTAWFNISSITSVTVAYQ